MPDEPTYWEYERFNVLDIVRVRLSPECTYEREVTHRGRRFTIPHYPETDGAVGPVIMISPTVPGHPYCVGLDMLRGEINPSTDRFAACELELVRRRPARRLGGEQGAGSGGE